MSERELLNMSQSVSSEGGTKNLQQRIEEMPKVNLLLSDDTVYGHQGTIRLASGMIDSQTGSASFRAVFSNPNEVLRSGASGQVQIPYKYDSIIAIPKRATYEVQNKIFVYTVTDSNSVKSTSISVQSLSTKSLYVVTDGLNGNNKIVLSGMGSLQDGAKINPQPVDADSLYQSLTEQDQPADTSSDS
jgi:membrane fusion protein (multidrug efflux system)